jgi:hypothetical protein
LRGWIFQDPEDGASFEPSTFYCASKRRHQTPSDEGSADESEEEEEEEETSAKKRKFDSRSQLSK